MEATTAELAKVSRSMVSTVGAMSAQLRGTGTHLNLLTENVGTLASRLNDMTVHVNALTGRVNELTVSVTRLHAENEESAAMTEDLRDTMAELRASYDRQHGMLGDAIRLVGTLAERSSQDIDDHEARIRKLEKKTG